MFYDRVTSLALKSLHGAMVNQWVEILAAQIKALHTYDQKNLFICLDWLSNWRIFQLNPTIISRRYGLYIPHCQSVSICLCRLQSQTPYSSAFPFSARSAAKHIKTAMILTASNNNLSYQSMDRPPSPLSQPLSIWTGTSSTSSTSVFLLHLFQTRIFA